MRGRRTGLCAMGLVALLFGCGPKPPPQGAFTEGATLLESMAKRRSSIRSARITGRVDHFGEAHRVQGKVFIFAELPDRLRMELVSPFGSPLTVLTVSNGRFALNDLRKGTYQEGPAEPCNIARLVQIPLPVEDVIRILIGDTPLLDGEPNVTWDGDDGTYRVQIEQPGRTQVLRIGPSERTLPLLRSRLDGNRGKIFSIDYGRWTNVGATSVPREIRVEMPGEKVDLLLRYDEDGVELNVELPADAWRQTPPPGVNVESVSCQGHETSGA